MMRKRIVQLEDQELIENTENLYNSKNPKYEMIEDEFDCDKCDHAKLLQEYKKKLAPRKGNPTQPILQGS